jgi:hypothetical protein
VVVAAMVIHKESGEDGKRVFLFVLAVLFVENKNRRRI